MQLEDKVVLVTGASKGIGRAIAVGMAREGAHVAVNYHSDQAGAEAACREIEALGRKAIAVGGNVGKRTDIDRMVRTVFAQFGHIDALVNNAAITHWSPVFELEEDDFDRVLDINLKGPFFLSMAVAKVMQQRGGGAIVNVSSIVEERAVKYLTCYTAAKGGLEAMTRQLALELAPMGIRVNCFGPGATVVQRNLDDDPDYDRKWGRVVPLGRAGTAEDMVGPAVFLASDQSKYVTGQIFYVDGGWTSAGATPDLDFVDDKYAKG
ncbi:MAG TPA: 3-oxoacyl-ACP reductase family protein [Limnochordia bacterium]|nr:3-oxoacyl-ACP reductase family protein [Limnochordia bacterium]